MLLGNSKTCRRDVRNEFLLFKNQSKKLANEQSVKLVPQILQATFVSDRLLLGLNSFFHGIEHVTVPTYEAIVLTYVF